MSAHTHTHTSLYLDTREGILVPSFAVVGS